MRLKDLVSEALIGKKIRCKAFFEGGDWYVSLHEDYMTFTVKDVSFISDLYELETDLGNLVLYNFDEFEIL